MPSISSLKGATSAYKSTQILSAAPPASSSFHEIMDWMQQTAQNLRSNETQTLNYTLGKGGDMADAAIDTAVTATTIEAISALTQKLTSVYNDLMKMNL